MIMGRCKKCGREGYLDTFEHIPCYGTVCTDGYGCAIPPSENTCVCCGEVIPEGRQVCAICCEKVADVVLKIEPPKSPFLIHPIGQDHDSKPVNIHKIIDDAMEKRDRTVSIYIGEAGVSVNVYPVDHDKCQWIYRKYPDRYHFECSNCGTDSEFNTTYCGGCGELMHGVRKEDTNE